MAATRRRSTRVSGVSAPSRLPTTPSSIKLSALIERDDSPKNATSNLDALVSSSAASTLPPLASTPTRVKAPPTGSRIAVPASEGSSHKSHHTVHNAPPLAGPLSSHPPTTLPRSPSKIAIATHRQQAPPKRQSMAITDMASQTFDFSFDKPESDLSSEAQKIMDSVREEAARIKIQLTEEKNKQAQADDNANQLFGAGGRPIRQAKGKSGRFSDIHRAEFKKMDSITNHASTWKNKLQGAASSPLKRSPSKAGLDETPKSLPRTKSFKNLYTATTERLENPCSGKRAKKTHDKDASAARPVSQDTMHSVQTVPLKSPAAELPSGITTPTKSSLARSASVKSLKTTMIPTLMHSTSSKSLRSPPKTEGSNRRAGSWSKFGGNVKSILHRAQPKFSNDPFKIAGGTHLPMPKSAGSDIEKALPSLPGTPTIKRVNFSPSTTSRYEAALAATSPSPTKAGKATVSSSPSKPGDEGITYPDLTASPNINMMRAKSPKCALPRPSSNPNAKDNKEGPENFTFRADLAKGITFQAPNSPQSRTPTIRAVRPSGSVSTTMPGSFDVPSPTPPMKEPIEHGLSNKKRKHSSVDDDEDAENIDPRAQSDVPSSPAKKAKTTSSAAVGGGLYPTLKDVSPIKTSPTKRRILGNAVRSGSPSPAGKKKTGGISLSRLNMLARPKQR